MTAVSLPRWVVLLVSLAGCKATWTATDIDGDGYTLLDGDCYEGSASVHAGAQETWYDGLDQDCDGNDADRDGDAYIPLSYALDFPNWRTRFPGHAEFEVGDCWDDFSDTSFVADYTPVLVDGYPSARPTAIQVNPLSLERWYDGVDMNCDGLSDFDQDKDGYDSANDPRLDGSVGEDCVDGSERDEVFTDEMGEPIDLTLDPDEIHPGLDEAWYDGIDQDCGGEDDYDQDGDGFRVADECDDEDPLVFPDDEASDTWYDCLDSNCDGNDGDQDGDGVVPSDYAAACPSWADINLASESGDCWDDPSLNLPELHPINGWNELTADQVYPGAVDRPYDGIDQDCAGDDDEFDADEDGYPSSSWPDRDGASGTDCEDDDPTVNPGFKELCSTSITDDNCDGDTNDLNATGCKTWYKDSDKDSYGASSSSQCTCVAEGDYSASTSTDCDDSRKTVYPGATESCNSLDDDCDSSTDEGVKSSWYTDGDSDGYGKAGTATSSCTAPAGKVADSSDCDDSDSGVNPGATEVCDTSATDEDCDGLADDADPSVTQTSTWYPDLDGDGYGDASAPVEACLQPASTLTTGGDCDDGESTAYPGSTSTEVPFDAVDQDCDGFDECLDLDCDGLPDLILVRSSSSSGGVSLVSDLYFGADSYALADTLASSAAAAAATADLNGDGYLDIVFANFQSSTSYEINSTIYWGSAAGFTSSTSLPTKGAVDVEIADLNNDSWPDLVFANYRTDVGTSADSLVYWSSSGAFSSGSKTSLITDYAGSVTVFDLDQDSYPDIIFSNTGAYATTTKSYIYFGSSGGYSTAKRTDLSVVGSWEHGIGDLDGDGYYDLVFGSYAKALSSSVDSYNTTSRVFWGSGTGWSDSDVSDFTTYGVGWVLVMDLDQDGYDDVVFANERSGNSSGPSYSLDSYVYYGSSSGLDPARDELATRSAEKPSAADLDDDGFIDLVIPFYRESSGDYEYSSQIFWGSSSGYSDSDIQKLTTQGASGVSLGDLDRDGAPELIFTGYRTNSAYTASTKIYDGGSSWVTVTNLNSSGVWFPPLLVGHTDW